MKIKIKQLNNEIISLNKRLKKNNHSFKKLLISKEVEINIIDKRNNIKKINIKNNEKTQKQIKEYNDNSKGNNYNISLITKEKKEKTKKKYNKSINKKISMSNNSSNKIASKTKSKIYKANISKLNKNKIHINYMNKIHKNMSNIIDIFHDQNDYNFPYDINPIDSASFKRENKKSKSKEISPSANEKLKYTTINHNNNRNNSQIINGDGNIEKLNLYKKIKDYHKIFDRKLSQITRNIMPKSIRRTLSAFHNIRNSSPNFYDSYRNLCSNNIKNINKNANLNVKRKNKFKQLNNSNSNNYINISANSNQKGHLNYFRKKTPHRLNSQRKEITPNLKINNNFHNFYSNSSSKTKNIYNDNIRRSRDNSTLKRSKGIINNIHNISAPNTSNFNSYNSAKDSDKIQNLFGSNNNLKNINKINNNNVIDGMLNNVLIIANIKNKFEVNTVSHGANKHTTFKKLKYNLSNGSNK